MLSLVGCMIFIGKTSSYVAIRIITTWILSMLVVKVFSQLAMRVPQSEDSVLGFLLAYCQRNEDLLLVRLVLPHEPTDLILFIEIVATSQRHSLSQIRRSHLQLNVTLELSYEDMLVFSRKFTAASHDDREG